MFICTYTRELNIRKLYTRSLQRRAIARRRRRQGPYRSSMKKARKRPRLSRAHREWAVPARVEGAGGGGEAREGGGVVMTWRSLTKTNKRMKRLA